MRNTTPDSVFFYWGPEVVSNRAPTSLQMGTLALLAHACELDFSHVQLHLCACNVVVVAAVVLMMVVVVVIAAVPYLLPGVCMREHGMRITW